MRTHDIPLSASQIVKAFGGPTVLSRHPALAAQRSAIANWPKDGIPSRHWPALARIAASSSDTQHITIEELERHTHPVSASAVMA
jgi:hypothetical protein